jgi:hypothetical protein
MHQYIGSLEATLKKETVEANGSMAMVEGCRFPGMGPHLLISGD